MKRKVNARRNISRGGFMLNNKKSTLSTKGYISSRLVNPSSCDGGGCAPISFSVGEKKTQSSYILEKAYNCGNNHNNISGNIGNCNNTCYDKNNSRVVKSIVTTGALTSSQHIRNKLGNCS